MPVIQILGGSEIAAENAQASDGTTTEDDIVERPKKSDFPNLSKEADVVWPVLEMCWNREPRARPTMAEVLAVIKILA